MPKLWGLLRGRDEQRLTIDEYAQFFAYNGSQYALTASSSTSDTEASDGGFAMRVQSAYKTGGVVFACLTVRMLLLSEARFQWQSMASGRPGELFDTPDLALLERPWPNGTTGELIARMEQDASLAGNAYVLRESNRLRRLRPDWVSIILTAPPSEAVQADVAGYAYTPGGKGKPELFDVGDVAHWSPIPDPEAQYRGMSWVTPVVREVSADKAATLHKLKFFENGASPQLAVSLKENVTLDQFKQFIAATNEAHQGVKNAYKTLYLGGGADVTVLGQNLRQLDFKLTQGAGETRIAAAAGVAPVIVGLSEGLQSATYSNYGQARRRLGDGTLRPLWRSMAGSLETIMPPPTAARLWYDDRDIAFLREDAMDEVSILRERMATIESGIRAGYTPESIVDAVEAGDLGRLKHTGLFSVQLRPPDDGTQPVPQNNEGNDN